jgi:hypothetical protein
MAALPLLLSHSEGLHPLFGRRRSGRRHQSSRSWPWQVQQNLSLAIKPLSTPVRFAKQTLGWTTPRLRHSAQAERWTWLVLAAYTRLHLARQLARDQRLPSERPDRPASCHPTGSAGSFRDCCARWAHPPPRQTLRALPRSAQRPPLRPRPAPPGDQEARHQAQEEGHQDRQARLTAPPPAPHNRRRVNGQLRTPPGQITSSREGSIGVVHSQAELATYGSFQARDFLYPVTQPLGRFDSVAGASVREVRPLADRQPPGSACTPEEWSRPRRRGRSGRRPCPCLCRRR